MFHMGKITLKHKLPGNPGIREARSLVEHNVHTNSNERIYQSEMDKQAAMGRVTGTRVKGTGPDRKNRVKDC